MRLQAIQYVGGCKIGLAQGNRVHFDDDRGRVCGRKEFGSSIDHHWFGPLCIDLEQIKMRKTSGDESFIERDGPNLDAVIAVAEEIVGSGSSGD